MNEVVNRDRAIRMARQAQGVPGSAAGDGERWTRDSAPDNGSAPEVANRIVQSLWHGHMSPTARALMGLAGGGLFIYGLTQKAPLACVLGTVGLFLAAEAAANASLEDIAHIPEQAADVATRAASDVAGTFGIG